MTYKLKSTISLRLLTIKNDEGVWQNICISGHKFFGNKSRILWTSNRNHMVWCISVSTYSKVSIKRPVLLNDLVWIFSKSFYQTTRSISEKIDHTVLFQGPHSQFLVSIKRPGLDICKMSLLNNQYILSFFQILEAYNDQVI